MMHNQSVRFTQKHNNFQKNTVTMTETSMRKNAVLHRFEYTLDEQGRLKQKIHFMRCYKVGAAGSDLDMAQDISHYTTDHYSYDNKGRLCEIKTMLIHGLPEGSTERTMFEYDGQGRLVRQLDYYYRDKKERLSYEEVYEYLSDTRIRVTMKLFTKEPKHDSVLRSSHEEA